jgi:hypothetical protein
MCRKLFDVIKEHVNIKEDVLEREVLDFEKSAWIAVQEAFPWAAVRDCIFHWKMSLRWKIQALGLLHLYNREPEQGCQMAAVTATFLKCGSFKK